MRGLGISDSVFRQIVGVRGGGPFLGPNGSPLSESDFNTLNTYWDRYRGADRFIGASGPYAWMNTAENPVDRRAWNFLDANWPVIRGARYFTDINWADRITGLPDYYYEIYPQAMVAEPVPELPQPPTGTAAPAPAPAPPASNPSFPVYTPTYSGGGGGGALSYDALPDSETPATPQVQKAGLFGNLNPMMLASIAGAILFFSLARGAGQVKPRRRRRR